MFSLVRTRVYNVANLGTSLTSERYHLWRVRWLESSLIPCYCPGWPHNPWRPATTVRLNVEENQLVNAFGEFGICLGGLKGA